MEPSSFTSKPTDMKEIKFFADHSLNNEIILRGYQQWGKKREVLRVMYYEKRHPSCKYFLMEKIGRRWYEYGHYTSLEQAISRENMPFRPQSTAKQQP
jgi:hypothetical protein